MPLEICLIYFTAKGSHLEYVIFQVDGMYLFPVFKMEVGADILIMVLIYHVPTVFSEGQIR